MDLSIIIVNWNSIEFAKDCIASIHSTIQTLDYEIIVFDNASEEDCMVVLDTHPNVRLVHSDRNVGFAQANNLGFEHSKGEKILFLNPDTLVLGDAILRMVIQLDSKPGIGVVGCRLLNTDRTVQLSCVQRFPSIVNQLISIGWLKRRWPKLPVWGMQALFSENPNGVYDVDAISGACLMVKRDVFENVGRFSTEYFMYAEEADLCHKIRCLGWKVCHISSAQVVHFGGQSSKKQGDAFSDIIMRESIFKLLRKFRGNQYAQLYRVALFLSAIIRLTVLSPLLAMPQGFLRYHDPARAFRKWRNIAKWALVRRQWSQGC